MNPTVIRCNCPQCNPVTGDCPAAFEANPLAPELERLRAALEYVQANHHEGAGEFDDMITAALGKERP